MREQQLRLSLFGLLVSVLACGAGCSQSLSKPRDRIGALPFPGVFTLYSSANVDKLGTHRYELTPRLIHDESNGIVYTQRAGFLDVAHIRITVDTVRFCADRIRTALREKQTTVKLPTLEGSIFIITLHYPPGGLSGMSAPGNYQAEELIADDLAIRVAQRVTFLMMTWHEVLTWYGYRTIGIIDEQPSAFTWDDTMSHYVALHIAGRVLRETSAESYDDRMTVAIRDELKDLGALSPALTDKAAYAVEGLWWEHGKPLKRQVDIGLFDNTIQPWLIPGFSPESSSPETFTLPTLTDVQGHDFSGFYSVQIEPRVHVEDYMRGFLPNRPPLFDGYQDMGQLMEVMRSQMKERFAADVDRPWPTATPRPATDAPPVTLAPAVQRPLR